MDGVLVAIDPGLRGCGVAVFVAGVLLTAFYVDGIEKRARGPKVWRKLAMQVLAALPAMRIHVLLIEIPQTYADHKSRADDLHQLTGVAGAIASAVASDEVWGVFPRTWTGRIAKTERHSELLATMSPEELAKIIAPQFKTYTHNIFDAVGIGRWYLQKGKSLLG
jgi:hypothetical protein